MILIIVAALGVTAGYALGMTRLGFVVMAAVLLGSLAVEIGLLLTSANHAEMTMAPVVAGALFAGSMLLGASSKRLSRDDSMSKPEQR